MFTIVDNNNKQNKNYNPKLQKLPQIRSNGKTINVSIMLWKTHFNWSIAVSWSFEVKLTISPEKALHDHPMFGKEHQPFLQMINELDNPYHWAS